MNQMGFFQNIRFGVHQKDAFHLLQTLPDESIDLFVTDPPYESLEKHRAIGTTTRLQNWFQTIPNESFSKLFSEMFRTAKRNTHLYLFCDHETMFIAKPKLEEAGWRYWNVITWDKAKIGTGWHYRHQKEFILFVEKGKRKLNNLGIGDVLRVPSIRGGYPTEKPVDLMKTLISQSSSPGEIVCDPFMGSGATLVAASELGRKYLGCDISTKAVNLTTTRLERTKK